MFLTFAVWHKQHQHHINTMTPARTQD